MALNYSNGNDIIVTSSTETYRGLGGDDTYIISKGLYKNSDITIIDTNGKNTIQLIDDINLTQTKISKDAIQFVLSNNAISAPRLKALKILIVIVTLCFPASVRACLVP